MDLIKVGNKKTQTENKAGLRGQNQPEAETPEMPVIQRHPTDPQER